MPGTNPRLVKAGSAAYTVYEELALEAITATTVVNAYYRNTTRYNGAKTMIDNIQGSKAPSKVLIWKLLTAKFRPANRKPYPSTKREIFFERQVLINGNN